MTLDLEYNTNRNDMVIPEYGRHIQKMIHYAMSLEDKQKRQKAVDSIIKVMGNMSPHLRDVKDFQHKLWDQLFIISNFELEIDSPFPKINKAIFEKKPEPLNYPNKVMKYRYYGENLINMLGYVSKIEDKEKKIALSIKIANQMKKMYLLWNKDIVENSIIFDHIKKLTNNEIQLDASIELLESEVLLKNIKIQKPFLQKRFKKYRPKQTKKHV